MRDGERDGDDASAFVDALASLKERGSALLVVGTVPESEYFEASRLMVGAPDAAQPRRRLLLVSGDGAGVRERLSHARTLGPDTCRVVTYETNARSATASATGTNVPSESVPVRRVENGSLADLGVAIDAAIDAFDAASDGGLSPAELRVAFDLLPALLSEYDVERVFRFLHLFTMQVRAAGGIGHVYLPKPRTDETTRTFTPLFDATVELRIDGGDLKQRWRFRDRDVVSEWLSFDASRPR